MHVTLRVAEHVWNLRSRRSFAVLAPALAEGMDRFGMRLLKFSVQGNHIHLLVESGDRKALGRAIKGLSVRIARGLNALMERHGRVLADRYHARVLRTPAEVRNAIHYVEKNARKHAAQWGERLPSSWVDPYSSESPALGFDLPRPATWLLRVGHPAQDQPKHR
ncbi:MAG TPA: transposase [Polyangia bacterium]|nr:transposase [Polyangia bacterium]